MTPQNALLTANPFKVGLLSFSDGRFRVHKTLEDAIVRHSKTLQKAIESDPLLSAVEAGEIAWSSRLARQNARQMRAEVVEAAVFNVPVFAFPNFSVISARVMGLPVLLSSPKDGKLPGLGGIMAAHGAMRQIGLPAWKIWGNPLEEAGLMDTLSAFCRASGVIERMKGSVYGLIGGRSIGMNTGVVNTAQWMRDFGVDVEHVDQLEIIRRAQNVDEEEVNYAYDWLNHHVGKVATEGKAVPDNVKQQIRHYIALHSIIDDLGLDFIGLKCHYDLSEYFSTACVSAVFLNDPYDWNGPKEPTMTACEADGDGALTMQVLKLISGYPSLLFDVRSYDFDDKVFICCNCGAQPSWYAARSDDPVENLAKVALEPVISKYGGTGAHFTYVCRAGEVTLARLTRVEGQYRLFLAKGEFVDFPPEKMAQTCSAWPHGYIRMNISPDVFVDRFNTNHAHVVPGDHRRALTFWADMLNIPVDCVEN